jgi:hypothetical protein
MGACYASISFCEGKNKGVGSLFSPPAITDDLEAALAQAR